MIKSFDIKNFKDKSSFEVSKIFKKTYIDYKNSANTSNSKLFFKQNTKNIDKFLFQIFSYLSANSFKHNSFVSFAWDCGLNLGLRVVNIDNIDEMYDLAKNDITIKTSLLESRYIFGSKKIYEDFELFVKNLRQIDKKAFVEEQLTTHTQRLQKYPLNMQVNLKDGYGGIREANMLFWILNVVYDVQKAKELVGTKLNYDSYKKFTIALDFLFQTRNALHTIHKKKVDTITFDTLPEVSSKLNFKNEFEFMAKLFSSLHIIHNFHSNMSSKFIRTMFFDTSNLEVLRKSRFKKGIYILDNKIYCSFHRSFVDLKTLLKELISFPQTIKGFDRSYIYFASRVKIPKIINKSLKKDIKTLLTNENLYPILKLFYNSELINILIPSFKKISNLAQFDGYHKHPVDIHTLQTVKYSMYIEDEFIKSVFNSLCKEEQILTRLIALFHDIGKGRKKDHHIIGENIFKKTMKNFGFDDEFIKILKNINELKILYVVIYCDICAVNKPLYNSSISPLLKKQKKKSILAF